MAFIFSIIVWVKKMGKFNFNELIAKPQKIQDEFWDYYEQLIRFQEKDAKANGGKGNVVFYDFDGFNSKNLDSLEGSIWRIFTIPVIIST